MKAQHCQCFFFNFVYRAQWLWRRGLYSEEKIQKTLILVFEVIYCTFFQFLAHYAVVHSCRYPLPFFLFFGPTYVLKNGDNLDQGGRQSWKLLVPVIQTYLKQKKTWKMSLRHAIDRMQIYKLYIIVDSKPRSFFFSCRCRRSAFSCLLCIVSCW